MSQSGSDASPTHRGTVSERLDALESRVAIGEIAADYCRGLDHRDVGVFVGLWHDDGGYSIPGRADYSGSSGVEAALDVIDRIWSLNRHWTSNHTVRFEGPDRARGRADVFSVGQERASGGTCLTGATYDDVYDRRDGVWRFAHRTTTRWFVSPPRSIPLPPPE